VGEYELNADADVLERREGGVEVEMRMGTGEEEWRKMPRGKYPKKRGIGRGCRRGRKGRISESMQDELSRETRKSKQQWSEKDGVCNSEGR
jgi:hypothetical protein